MAFADVNGQRIHFEDTGGDGPVLAFSHGLLMDGSMWDPQVEALRSRYRCITWDERGHGRTESDGASFTYWESASDLVALLDHLRVSRATLIGMSQGGYLTQRAAVEMPGLVESLVFVASQAGTEDPEKVGLYGALLDAWERDGLGPELARTVAAIVLGADWEGAPCGSRSGSGWTPRRCAGRSRRCSPARTSPRDWASSTARPWSSGATGTRRSPPSAPVRWPPDCRRDRSRWSPAAATP